MWKSISGGRKREREESKNSSQPEMGGSLTFLSLPWLESSSESFYKYSLNTNFVMRMVLEKSKKKI